MAYKLIEKDISVYKPIECTKKMNSFIGKTSLIKFDYLSNLIDGEVCLKSQRLQKADVFKLK